MSNIVDINDYKPHLSGPAICLHCGHKWHAIAPVGTIAYVCPDCGLEKGILEGFVMPPAYYECGCGNAYYTISENGPMCVKCGKLCEAWN